MEQYTLLIFHTRLELDGSYIVQHLTKEDVIRSRGFGYPSEQNATPNLTLRAATFQIINKIKEVAEANSNRVVSCTGILSLLASYIVAEANCNRVVLFYKGCWFISKMVFCNRYLMEKFVLKQCKGQSFYINNKYNNFKKNNVLMFMWYALHMSNS